MNKHREDLLKLMKMITAIQKVQILNATACGIEESKTGVYLADHDLLSLRELSRMFLNELNSEYLECDKDDEIVKFIEEISVWFENVYNAIVEDELTSPDNIKKLKICGQLKNDYNKVYFKAKVYIFKNYNNVMRLKEEQFKFGKRDLKEIERFDSYVGYSEQELDEKIKELGINNDKLVQYKNDDSRHLYKSLVIQAKLLELEKAKE